MATRIIRVVALGLLIVLSLLQFSGLITIHPWWLGLLGWAIFYVLGALDAASET